MKFVFEFKYLVFNYKNNDLKAQEIILVLFLLSKIAVANVRTLQLKN